MIRRSEALSWLNEYKHKIYNHKEMIDNSFVEDKSSELSPTIYCLYNQLLDLLKAENFTYAALVLDRLKSCAAHSMNSMERGEIWVACGMAFFEMTNYQEAVTSLKHAVDEYPALSHQRAVSRWLLGYSQWKLTTDDDAALANWDKAIEEFAALIEQAQYDHLENRKDWYEEKIKTLRENLKVQVSLHFP